MPRKRVAFLLGSGVSLPFETEIPNEPKSISTRGITKSLLRENQWAGKDDAQKFILLLDKHVRPNLSAHEGNLLTYEDYYEYLSQILQYDSGEITNPLIAETVKRIQVEWQKFPSKGTDGTAVEALVERAMDFIKHVVREALIPLTHEKLQPKPLEDHLRLIADVSRQYGNIDVFTLNHDLLLEEYLRQKGVGCCDGFGVLQQTDGSCRYCDGFYDWDGDVTRFRFKNLFDSWDSAKEPFCRLIKLHGSINWFYESPNGAPRISDRFIKLKPGQIQRFTDSSGKKIDYDEEQPLILSGTSLKEQEYGRNIFGAMFWKFRERLYQCDTLFCSGYGWADYGVNVCVDEWLFSAPGNRFVILHDLQEDDLRKKRFWEDKWTSYIDAKKLFHVNKWLCKCYWSDIQQYFVPCTGCRVQTQTCAASTIAPQA